MDVNNIKKYFDEMIVTLSDEDKDSPNISFLRQCVVDSINNNTVNILCKGELAKNYIEQNIIADIRNFISKKAEQNIEISIVVDQNIEIDEIEYSEEEQSIPVKTNTTNSSSFDSINYSGLNRYYKFDNFIRGTTNNFAVAASIRVSEQPGKEYNPLYIYGGVGLGKTHLIQSIGNTFLENNPNSRVIYIDGSSFREEFVSGIMSKRANDFKKKYRSLDMFLLDDLQLLETAQETSKELFDIFQALDSKNKQMVFVSDRPPKELQNIEARLKNRFEKSLILPIEPPQFETRLAIIEKKLQDYSTTIDKKIIEYLAQNITTDIRKLEGAIKSYLSMRDIMNITPNLEECIDKEIFKNYITTNTSIKNMTVKSMIKSIAKYYGVEESEILGQSRSKHITRIRHIAMYITSIYSGKSTTELGLEFRKDHASIIFARDKISEKKKTDLHISNEIDALIASI